jgi:hypothetical protein
MQDHWPQKKEEKEKEKEARMCKGQACAQA